MEHLAQHIEALIFSTEHPISLKEIKAALDTTFETTIGNDEILSVIGQMIQRYQEGNFAIEIMEVAEGFHFMSKTSFSCSGRYTPSSDD